MARLVRALKPRPTAVERQLDALKTHPHYAELREVDLRHSALRNVSRTVMMPLRGRIDGSRRRPRVIDVVHVVPDLGPEEVVSAYRLAMAVSGTHSSKKSARLELPAAIAAQGLREIWELTDHYSDLLAAAHGHAAPYGQPHRRTRALYLKRAFCGELKTSDPSWRRRSRTVPDRRCEYSVSASPVHPPSSCCGMPNRRRWGGRPRLWSPESTMISPDCAQERCQPLAGEESSDRECPSRSRCPRFTPDMCRPAISLTPRAGSSCTG